MRLGALRIAAEPIRVVACHCTECQRQSGSAFGISMPVKKDSLTVTGAGRGFSQARHFTRTADSGGEVAGVRKAGFLFPTVSKRLRDRLSAGREPDCMPVIDGSTGAPGIFDSDPTEGTRDHHDG
jgi:Glutathione-dependent formaldehyde-activating enzyme